MIEVLKQARNAFVWNLNTDLDNIPACDQWAKMLRKNIDDLDKVIAEFEQRTWVGLTDEEIKEGIRQSWVTEQAFQSAAWWAEAKLKEKNSA